MCITRDDGKYFCLWVRKYLKKKGAKAACTADWFP